MIGDLMSRAASSAALMVLRDNRDQLLEIPRDLLDGQLIVTQMCRIPVNLPQFPSSQMCAFPLMPIGRQMYIQYLVEVQLMAGIANLCSRATWSAMFSFFIDSKNFDDGGGGWLAGKPMMLPAYTTSSTYHS